MQYFACFFSFHHIRNTCAPTIVSSRNRVEGPPHTDHLITFNSSTRIFTPFLPRPRVSTTWDCWICIRKPGVGVRFILTTVLYPVHDTDKFIIFLEIGVCPFKNIPLGMRPRSPGDDVIHQNNHRGQTNRQCRPHPPHAAFRALPDEPP